MKFIAGLRVWGNWKIGENVLKVFLRLRGSANRRVDFHLPLIASIPGRFRTGYRRGYRLWKPARRQARPTRDRVAQARAEWDGQTRKSCQNEPIYERPVVKRGGADFVSQGSRTSPSPSASVDLAHLRPVRRRFSVHPATHPLSPRPRESFLPQCRQCTKR